MTHIHGKTDYEERESSPLVGVRRYRQKGDGTVQLLFQPVQLSAVTNFTERLDKGYVNKKPALSSRIYVMWQAVLVCICNHKTKITASTKCAVMR